MFVIVLRLAGKYTLAANKIIVVTYVIRLSYLTVIPTSIWDIRYTCMNACTYTGLTISTFTVG